MTDEQLEAAIKDILEDAHSDATYLSGSTGEYWTSETDMVNYALPRLMELFKQKKA